MEHTSFDSLIFDMDSTLWDAVDTYVKIWNVTYSRLGLDASTDRTQLLQCMGMTLDSIIDRIASVSVDRKLFAGTLRAVDKEILPRDGGTLYDGVAELIPELARHYKLFMVSNCGPDGLNMFLDFTGLRPWFTDTLTNGETHRPKEDNMLTLIQRHGLKAPVYIGDTEGDCRSTHAAGLPFMHAAYGFGSAPDADFRANTFREIADFFLQPKQ